MNFKESPYECLSQLEWDNKPDTPNKFIISKLSQIANSNNGHCRRDFYSFFLAHQKTCKKALS